MKEEISNATGNLPPCVVQQLNQLLCSGATNLPAAALDIPPPTTDPLLGIHLDDFESQSASSTLNSIPLVTPDPSLSSQMAPLDVWDSSTIATEDFTQNDAEFTGIPNPAQFAQNCAAGCINTYASGPINTSTVTGQPQTVYSNNTSYAGQQTFYQTPNPSPSTCSPRPPGPDFDFQPQPTCPPHPPGPCPPGPEFGAQPPCALPPRPQPTADEIASSVASEYDEEVLSNQSTVTGQPYTVYSDTSYSGQQTFYPTPDRPCPSVSQPPTADEIAQSVTSEYDEETISTVTGQPQTVYSDNTSYSGQQTFYPTPDRPCPQTASTASTSTVNTPASSYYEETVNTPASSYYEETVNTPASSYYEETVNTVTPKPSCGSVHQPSWSGSSLTNDAPSWTGSHMSSITGNATCGGAKPNCYQKCDKKCNAMVQQFKDHMKANGCPVVAFVAKPCSKKRKQSRNCRQKKKCRISCDCS